MNNGRKIYVAGDRGMVGSAIMRRLSASKEAGEDLTLITASRNELDLLDQKGVRDFLHDQRIDEVILAAAKVGGIHANFTQPAEFIYENLTIQSNVIHQSYKANIHRLLFLGSSCIYPKLADQPMAEDALLTGQLEPTNEPYAIAKIAGLKLCESYNRQFGVDFRSVMPTNLYGPGDNFHPENSHVLPSLIRRFHEAKLSGADKVVIWGTGTPRREFLHVDDMADAALFLFNLPLRAYQKNTTPMQSHVNVGTGKDISILELASLVAEVVGYEGKLSTDDSKPDGAPRKLLEVSKLTRLGWQAQISLREGIASTYEWFQKNSYRS